MAPSVSTFPTLTADTGRPQLRCASERICVVPHTHNSFRDTSFSAVGPREWNTLPWYLRQNMIIDISREHWWACV